MKLYIVSIFRLTRVKIKSPLEPMAFQKIVDLRYPIPVQRATGKRGSEATAFLLQVKIFYISFTVMGS